MSFEAMLLAIGAAAVLVVAVLALVTMKVAADATAAAQWVNHSQEVISDLANVRAETLRVELSTQSYRISGDKSRLLERDQAMVVREELLAQIRTLLADNAVQLQRWSALRQLVDQRIGIARQVEQLRDSQGAAAANAFVAAAPIQQTRVRLYQVLHEMDQLEHTQLQQRHADSLAARQRLVYFGVATALALIALLAGGCKLVLRQLRQIRDSQQALAHSQESLATTLQSIGDGVLATDTEGRITRMNPVAERLTGWSLAQAQGRPVQEVFCIVQEQTREPAEVPVERVLAIGAIHEIASNSLLLARDGRQYPIADSAAPIRNQAGAILGVVIVFRDDSGARRLEQDRLEQNLLLEQRVQERTTQLRASEEHLRSVINSVPALIAFVDAKQRYVYVNSQYQQRFAPEQASIIGQTVQQVLGPQRYATAAPVIAMALQGQPQSYDWQAFPGIWLQINYLPVNDLHGAVAGYYVLGTDITGRVCSEAALRESEQRLERVIEGANQGYWEWDLQSNAFKVSARWETLLGYAPGEMDTGPEHWPQLVHPDDLPLALASIERHKQGLSPNHEVEIRVKTHQGQWRWIQTSGRIVTHSEDGRPLLMSGTHTDICERKELELLQGEAAAVFANSYEAIMVVNAQGLITRVNAAFTRITGYTQEEVAGQSPRLLSSGRHDVRFFQDFWLALNTTGAWRGEIWNRRKSGDVFAVLQSVAVVRDVKGQLLHYVSVFADISQLKAHEAELDRVANYDSLTHLPNRRLLSDRLKQAILRADRSGKSCAICFLDLDGFKTVNDQLGHGVGDQVLLGVALNLTGILRAEDTLARLGGDEFVVLLSEVGTAEECTLILERMLEAARIPVQAGEHLVHVSASVGVSLYPSDNADPDILLRHADMAMYLAKQAGKNRYQLFDPEIDRVAQSHSEYLAQMQQALQRQEFVLHYQPKVDLESGAVIGAEALIRWQQPERGLLAPAEFLPHLNGSHLEAAFGEWVIRTALAQMRDWGLQGLDIKVSVNISANHLQQPDFCEHLAAALELFPDVARASLELEVLETAALADVDLAVEILERCMELGVRFSLDDFGTGYSSLTYLRKLPVQTLKNLAKQAGKNRYQLFDPEIDRVAQSHSEYLAQMQQALQRQEFVLHYQPKVDLESGAVIGAEALIRWQQPERGLLAPAEFLPHLNGSHLEAAFGEWVIRTALAQMRDWGLQGLDIKVSVNISANHLQQPDFCEHLAAALELFPDVARASLELEVLETAALADVDLAVEILERCMELGVRFSLDDFGTGYSSLTYLRKLPVQTLKIDQSFVRNMLVDADDMGIVHGIIELASAFGRQVVAEGVETLEHGARLRSMGCRLVQGYGIARPMPAAALPPWCAEWQKAGRWRSI
jgi:diguanylate cyclase (GGDEF)-like protein/PAS domain S-box-containing protein